MDDDLQALLDNPEQLAEILANADPALVKELQWKMAARASQLPPEDNSWTYWIYRAGRGAGKTRACAEWVRKKVEIEGVKHALLIGANASNARDILAKGPSGILAICPTARFVASERKIIWENGAEAKILTSEEPDAIRGFSAEIAWCDEISSWKYERDTWRNIIACLREGTNPQVVVTSTPQRTSVMREIEGYEGTIVSTSSTYENKHNLPKTFLDALEENYAGTLLYRQEILGEYLEQAEGAMYNEEDILHGEAPTSSYDQGCISIDPAVTVSENSDETGIIVAARLADYAFIIDDFSGKHSIDVWAQKAVDLQHELGFMILAETNNGGDLIVKAVKDKDPYARIKRIHAIASKTDRLAEAAMYYQQHKVIHTKVFKDLELQMISWVPPLPGKSAKGSPDRADAGAQALRYLFGKRKAPSLVHLPPKLTNRIATTRKGRIQ